MLNPGAVRTFVNVLASDNTPDNKLDNILRNRVRKKGTSGGGTADVERHNSD